MAKAAACILRHPVPVIPKGICGFQHTEICWCKFPAVVKGEFSYHGLVNNWGKFSFHDVCFNCRMGRFIIYIGGCAFWGWFHCAFIWKHITVCWYWWQTSVGIKCGNNLIPNRDYISLHQFLSIGFYLRRHLLFFFFAATWKCQDTNGHNGGDSSFHINEDIIYTQKYSIRPKAQRYDRNFS